MHEPTSQGLPTVGRDGPRWFAVTAAEARRALAHFVEHRPAHFGPHEDAPLAGDWAMAHSLLSVPLNLGLLHPLDVVGEAEAAYRSGDVPIASAEGFVRQVLGWRGYVWQLYWRFGRAYRHRNALRTPRCPTGGASSTPTRSPRPACATRWPASATAAGPTTSRG
ncbi:hypothetical protein [Pseudonocardia humida]|uniref:Uncharacterized protein n=1 Tax=Pseudonocardia humida TaxID=2800819 RepID=A0ABT0ZTW2_9PSEU|nr:hypothetical protein [Pseudonocardia humida]MCO1654152.1 hypothetical protein [Pseudonocardia humida]